MRWLITVRKSADLNKLCGVIRDCGGEAESAEAIPLGEDELVVRASGPAELSERLEQEAEVIEVFPESEPEAYSEDPVP